MIPALTPKTRAFALSAVLAWIAPRARAENSLAYKYEDYREEDGRIAVKTQGAYLEKDLGTDTHLSVNAVMDAITGATPSGQPAPSGSNQVVMSQLHSERRKAWDIDLSHQFSHVNIAVGAANSRESDYVSHGWSLNTLTDFNQKNTTMLFGVAGTDDDVRVFYQIPRAKKRTNDVILGVTQLLDPDTSLTFNVSWSRATGDLADQYKLVQEDVAIFPGVFLPLTFNENRPHDRNKGTGFLELNHTFRELNGSIDASYRYYRDTFGTEAHTVDLAWFQKLGEKFILRPGLRWYTQSAADFYYYNLDATSIVPRGGVPNPAGPFYSSDYRLSALQTWNYGLKLIWNATDHLSFDVAYERYEMHGRDGVTPQSAYPTAGVVTVGAKFSW